MRQGGLQPPQSHWIIQTESFCGPTEARIVLKRLNPLIRPGQGGLSLIIAETPDGKKQDIFVVDYHFHIWNAAKEKNGGMSRGWRLDSKEAFDFLEKNRELGINVQVAHKGPTVWPLDKDAFDIGDVDTAATSFPDMKFVVTHIGLPRLDDFCWVAMQDKNIYAGMAVAMAFVHTRPRYFAEMMANLLYWLGPDRILFSADYALWHPKWVIEDFLNFELPEDLKKEYGVDLTMENKKKILGENAAKVWGIDIEEQKKKHKNDELTKKLHLQPGTIRVGEAAKQGRPLAR